MIPLRDVRAAWAGGQRVGGMWAGGSKVWSAPSSPAPTEPVLSDFYGTGPGDVLWDIRLDAPVVDGGGAFVSATNDATSSAGVVSSGTTLPAVGDGYVTLSANTQGLALSSPVDLNGKHVLIPVYVRVATGSNQYPRPLWNSAGEENILLNFGSPTRFIVDNKPTGHPFANKSVNTPLQTGRWMLLEARYARGRYSLWFDGSLIAEGAATGRSYIVNRIAGLFSGVQWLDGRVGRVVIADVSSGSGEAVACARLTLMEQYDIPGNVMTHNNLPVTVTAVGRSTDAPIVTTGGSGLCHPKLLDIPGGWNGYRYWMAFTPYFGLVGRRDQYENPHVVVSNDLETWVEPADGAIDIPEDGNGSYWSDTHMALDDSGVMHLWYRGYNFSFASRCYVHRTSTDGVNWSPRAVFNIPGQGSLASAVAANEFLSPAIHRDGAEWACYDLVRATDNLGIGATAASTQTHVVRRTSPNPDDFGAYLPANVVQYSPRLWGTGQDPWHMDAIKVGGLYIHLVTTSNLGTSLAQGLYLCTSRDGLNFDVQPKMPLSKTPYRSSIHAVEAGSDGITLLVAVAYYDIGTIDLIRVKLDMQP